MRDDDDKPISDSDRAAILARRKQFIALALSGLATTSACTDGGEPARDGQSTDKKGGNEAKPEPCLTVPLDYVPPEPKSAPPQPCLNVAIIEPPPEAGGETGEAQADQPPPPPEPKPEPKPRPCLKKAAPKPCLNIAKPDPD